MKQLQSFKHDDWTKIWDGAWSFLTCTHFIEQYTKELTFGGKPFQSQAILFSSHGRSAGWMRQSDRDVLGACLSRQIIRNPKFAKTVSNNLKTQSKSFLRFMAHNENIVASPKLYNEFWRRLLAYYHPHINVKYVVDYLHPDLLKKYLPDLEAARLVAEPVFNHTENFIMNFAKFLSKKMKYDYRLLLCLTKEELRGYFSTETLPKKSELEQRNKRSALLCDRTSFVFYTGSAVNKIEKLLGQSENVSEVTGQVAFHGKVNGTVRIVLDPHKAKNFQRGDILVTGSTRPEFLSLMVKAGAIVTDAGGILSHAAITARELKKPCVIGTKIATKVFKDGDRVEVDAECGIIKKV
ncbi:MAG: PEP-utilizing enzyme [bacterium]|nr:PEP-utilizing enzyme [bacterium]